MPQASLQNIFKATVVPKMLYAIPSFWGFLTSQLKNNLQSILNRARKLNFYLPSDKSVIDLVNKQEQDLYIKIVTDNDHILHYLLPPTKTYLHNLRNKQKFLLPEKDDKQFIKRNISKIL